MKVSHHSYVFVVVCAEIKRGGAGGGGKLILKCFQLYNFGSKSGKGYFPISQVFIYNSNFSQDSRSVLVHTMFWRAATQVNSFETLSFYIISTRKIYVYMDWVKRKSLPLKNSLVENGIKKVETLLLLLRVLCLNSRLCRRLVSKFWLITRGVNWCN